MIPKEESSNGDDSKIYTSTSTSTSKCSRLKDPRIVRVSKAMGGKDRHSKVCTVRGLRDRRVRLSVPTAIQLYDLQERLGLNQPSKVVDWLLNAARNEIDQLPPLQIPQGITFSQMLNPNNEEDTINASTQHQSHLQNPSASTSNSSYSYGRWDLPQTPISLGLTAHQLFQDFSSHQHQHQHQHQLLVYQSGMITQPYFVPQINPESTSFHSTSAHVRPFDFNIAADLLPSQTNSVDEQNKRNLV